MQKLLCFSEISEASNRFNSMHCCFALSCALCFFLAGGRTFSGPLKSFFFVQFAIDSEIKLVLT